MLRLIQILLWLPLLALALWPAASLRADLHLASEASGRKHELATRTFPPMGWPVHRLGRLLRLEGACLDGPRRPKRNHNRHLHRRPAIAVPRALGDSLDCPGVPGMTILLRRSATICREPVLPSRAKIAKARVAFLRTL